MTCRHLLLLLLASATCAACSLDTGKKLGCRSNHDCEQGLICSPARQCVAPDADGGVKDQDAGAADDAGDKGTDAGMATAPTIWLRADLGVNPFDGKVYSWADQSPTGAYPALQTEKAWCPTFDAKGGPTGGPAVRFDGDDDHMIFGGKRLYSTKGGMTFFAVVRSDDARSLGTAGTDPMLLDFGAAGGADICLFYDYQSIGLRAPDSAAPPECAADTDTIGVGPSNHTPNKGKWAIATFEIIFKDQLRVRLDGMEIDHHAAPNLTELTAKEVPASDQREDCVGPITLGWQAKLQATGLRNLSGALAELRAYTTSLSEAERDAIECALSKTYKLSLLHACKGSK
jgi:hypothetical protein